MKVSEIENAVVLGWVIENIIAENDKDLLERMSLSEIVDKQISELFMYADAVSPASENRDHTEAFWKDLDKLTEDTCITRFIEKKSNG